MFLQKHDDNEINQNVHIPDGKTTNSIGHLASCS
jgi:hypothetical protein